MSQLLVDIGNSRLKWMLFDDQDIHTGVLDLFAGGIAVKLNVQWQDLQPGSVVLCSVANEKTTGEIFNWIESKWHCPVNHIHASNQFMGVTNAYAGPAQLGADRWATLVAARKLVTGAVCIVDYGTAITIDGMDASGQHIGGAIMPGMSLQKESLKGGTTMVDWQKDSSSKMPGLPITNTAAAIEYGASYGIAGAIDRLIVEFNKQLGDNMVVLLTGGGAPQIAGLLKSDYRLEKDLVLLGLALLGETQE